MKKNLFRTWIALLAALVMSLGCVIGETAETAEPVLLATVNSEEIFDNNTDLTDLVNYYSSYYASMGYDASDPGMQAMIRAYGLEWAVECALYRQKAAELGITGLTEEDVAALEAAARAEWEEAVAYYQSQVAPVGEDATEEDIAASRVTTLAYIESNFGYTEESYVREYVDGSVQTQIRQKVTDAEIGEISVSEQEIIDQFNAQVETDKASYEGNIFMYEYYTQYMGETSYYVPEGYRGITHILLEVDEDLLKNYTDLTARFEEQKEGPAEETTDDPDAEAEEPDAEEEEEEDGWEADATLEMEDGGEGDFESADEDGLFAELAAQAEDGEEAEEDAADETEDAEAEDAADEDESAESEEEAAEAPEPVTQEMVDAAKQAILDSVQPTIDEIMFKFNAGTPFADLIEEYGTDPGMQAEPSKSQGYMVHADSILWDPAFITGAMTLEKVGDVSEPVIGSYGIHILFYLRDVPAGAVDMTEEIRENIHDELLTAKESDAVSAMMERWTAEADIQYTEAGQALKDAGEAAMSSDSGDDEDEEGSFDLELEDEDDGEDMEIEWVEVDDEPEEETAAE